MNLQNSSSSRQINGQNYITQQHFVDQASNKRSQQQDGNFGIRIGKKRPMTTRKDGNGANVFSSNAKSMGGLMNQGSRQSGAFLFNKAGIKQQRDRSGEHSDDITRDNVTSQITGNVHGGYALDSSKNFNNTQQVFFSN